MAEAGYGARPTLVTPIIPATPITPITPVTPITHATHLTPITPITPLASPLHHLGPALRYPATQFGLESYA